MQLSKRDPDTPADKGLKRDVEALLFASGKPIAVETLTTAVSQVRPVDAEQLRAALYELENECGPVLDAMFVAEEERELSTASMETLAIIAYMQPVSRPEIADIRGVSSLSTVQTLMERDLIQEAGRQEGPGAAVVYETTERFEVFFGLQSVEYLPPLEEFQVPFEQREELRRRLGIVSAPE